MNRVYLKNKCVCLAMMNNNDLTCVWGGLACHIMTVTVTVNSIYLEKNLREYLCK